ncbi:MAG: DegT/DnrJ/EryC1/StrS family aminotransferase [Bacteroidales bacterium]
MIKFLDLKRVNEPYDSLIKDAINEVVNSGWYLLGKENRSFEESLAKYLKIKHVVPCASGLDALRLTLRAWLEMGVLNEGDEVIVPANTYVATVLAITDNRLKPIFVEPNPNSANIDVSKIEVAINERTRALVVVHLYGRSAWEKELELLAEKYGLKILEDNAQSMGAMYRDGRFCGTLGDAGACSFYPTKNLGALGDAGAVVTNDDELARTVRSLTNYGSRVKYQNIIKGANSRMDEIQAAVLGAKLPFLDADNNRRREIAEMFYNGINNSKIELFDKVSYSSEHVHHLFVIKCRERDRLLEYLMLGGVECQIHYPIPPHKQECYCEYVELSLPITEELARCSLSIPISPVMNHNEVECIIDLINKFQ